uniref:Modulator of smoothened b n=1 Tax=Cyprinus carpio carpio TaxID=630221 RepID=A0A9J7XUP0_CYPCA
MSLSRSRYLRNCKYCKSRLDQYRRSRGCVKGENRISCGVTLKGVSHGALTVGLVKQCQTIHGRTRVCISPSLPPEWITTLFFIILGIISLSITCGLLVISHWRREATKYARWIAFMGMVLFCMAALIFPVGFYINQVGGQPYKLPNNTVVGSSYVLFVLSIFFTIVGLLFAGKVCLPG